VLSTELAVAAQRYPQIKGQMEPLLQAGASETELVKELTKATSGSYELSAQLALRCVLLDHEARRAECADAKAECDAKSLRDWRNRTAIPAYKDLLGLEPDNIEGWFDLAQVNGQLQRTRDAIQAFNNILEIDPLHREAAIGLERASLDLNPQLTGLGTVFNQRGRNNLAVITRDRAGVLLACPYADEVDTLTVGYSRLYLDSPGYAPLSGNMITFAGAHRYDYNLQIYGIGNIEQYQDRISTRLTYDAGAQYFPCDGWKVQASTFLNNVLENGESIQQNIYRAGFNLGTDNVFSRYWQAGGNYRFAYYSDINRLSEFYLYNDTSVTLPPTQLKFVLSLDYMTFNQQTVFLIPDSSVGAIHPYFAPAGFMYYEGRAEWFHWLSRDYFVYANQCWYSLQYALGFDSNLQTYNNFRVILNADIKPWFSVGVQAEAMISDVYNMQQVYLYGVYRFPCKLW
jgi:tetratricopeptide (TPR) repeat protein